jgi:hypothetical protein
VKKIMPILLIFALIGGGYYVYTNYLGGSIGAPTNTPDADLPDVELPDPGDAVDTGAEGAENGAKGLADTIAGLSPAVWRVVALILVVLALAWVWKDPKRRTIALLLALFGVLVFFIGGR